MKKRTLILAVVGVAVCGAVAVLMVGGDDDAGATASTNASRVDAPHRAVAHAGTPAPSVPGAPAVATVAAPVGDDDTVYPVDPTPPSREAPLTEEERDPRLVRSVKMLDEAVARTEAHLADAEAKGDDAAANTARVRIKRLREVRKQRTLELGAMQ